MTERFYGGDDFEVDDNAFMCMTGDCIPDGLLWGYDADDDIIIGWIDAPDYSPAGAWEFIDNCFMRGAFAKIVRRPE